MYTPHSVKFIDDENFIILNTKTDNFGLYFYTFQNGFVKHFNDFEYLLGNNK